MKKVIQVLLIAVGAALLIFGVVSLFVVNADFGTVLTPIIGLGIVLCGVFYTKIIGSKSRIVKTLRISVVAAFCVCVAAACAIHFYGIHDTTAYDEDALIILGAGIHGDEPSLILKLRLDTGAEYAEKNPDAVIVVSGGRGPPGGYNRSPCYEKLFNRKGGCRRSYSYGGQGVKHNGKF